MPSFSKNVYGNQRMYGHAARRATNKRLDRKKNEFINTYKLSYKVLKITFSNYMQYE